MYIVDNRIVIFSIIPIIENGYIIFLKTVKECEKCSKKKNHYRKEILVPLN